MSSDSYRQQIQRQREEIGRLQGDKAKAMSRIADLQKQESSATQSASRTNSASMVTSYMRTAQSRRDDAIREQKKVADIEDKITRVSKAIADSEKSLARDLEYEARQRQSKLDREASERQRQEDQRRRETDSRMRKVDSQLRSHETRHQETEITLARLQSLPERIVVLFAAANPIPNASLHLDHEARSITESIRKSKYRDSVSLVTIWATRPSDLIQAINEHDPHIVHFSGHGADNSDLIFQAEGGGAHPVSRKAIARMIASASEHIQLVVFNSCFSEAQAREVVTYIPCAVGMNTSIGDQAAIAFAGQLYSSIGFGFSVQKSYDQAVAALIAEDVREEDNPQLFTKEGMDAKEIVLVRPVDLSNDSERDVTSGEQSFPKFLGRDEGERP